MALSNWRTKKLPLPYRSDIRRFPRALGEYIRHSPLTYARSVRTPVLIIHGEEDDRVPIEQGEQFFVALKRLGRDVEFVRLPGSHHGLMRNADLRMRQDYYERILEWFDRHLPG